jgi:hypothetical protein
LAVLIGAILKFIGFKIDPPPLALLGRAGGGEKSVVWKKDGGSVAAAEGTPPPIIIVCGTFAALIGALIGALGVKVVPP